jgi:hypothetical protein
MFKIGDRVKVISGFSVGSEGIVVSAPSGQGSLWPVWVMRDRASYPAGYYEKELKLISTKEATQTFEVGKKYHLKYRPDDIKECIWVEGDRAILRDPNRSWLDGGAYPTDKNNFTGYVEYVEPKVYTQEMKVSINDDYIYTHTGYTTKGVIGKIRITYTEGSGITVDVLK